jgi:hypothetical protein
MQSKPITTNPGNCVEELTSDQIEAVAGGYPYTPAPIMVAAALYFYRQLQK